MTEKLLLLAPIGSLAALLYAAALILWVKSRPQGDEKMRAIAAAIRKGARAYLSRQYRGVALFFGAMFLVLIFLAWRRFLPFVVPFAFLSGGFFSAMAGLIGMLVATAANVRTAAAAGHSLNRGLRVAFNSGAVMGLVVVGLGLLDLSLWYFGLDWYYTAQGMDQAGRLGIITSTMLNFGMGASSMALFARVGGGIFTKAADVGADLVGKVEAGIPEDDPRNPAVIADNVGDNVGDVAGMGADLYESYVGSIVATSALGVAAGHGLAGVTVPMIMAAVGVLASIVGTWFVRSGERAGQKALLSALRRGVFISAGLIALVSFFLIRGLLGPDNLGIYWSVLGGLAAGIIIGLSTEYFTSDIYHPTRSLAGYSVTGPATVIIGGLSVGMLSTVIPVIVVVATVLVSFYMSGGGSSFSAGLYGIAISAVGMLSTLGITLATDAYGPVADNAGGIAQMAGLPDEVRERTDALDALGNTTAATGKGFAIGSAALTALALIAAFHEQVDLIAARMGIDSGWNLTLLNPQVLAGLFIGAMLPFAFSSLAINAVGRAANKIVEEVRRQFKEIPGLMEGKAEPDYERSVDICITAAQLEMIAPTLLAILTPILVGVLFGVTAVAGLLAGSTVTGFLLAIMMANSGGSWDNAKKSIEGEPGAKGTSSHKAAVVGDTVGDPLKDTAGPSLNILIKLVSMVAVVFASFILQNSLARFLFK